MRHDNYFTMILVAVLTIAGAVAGISINSNATMENVVVGAKQVEVEADADVVVVDTIALADATVETQAVAAKNITMESIPVESVAVESEAETGTVDMAQEDEAETEATSVAETTAETTTGTTEEITTETVLSTEANVEIVTEAVTEMVTEIATESATVTVQMYDNDYVRVNVELTNGLRRGLGLNVLYVDPMLSEIAYEKAKDMIDNNYFGHKRDGRNITFELVGARMSFGNVGENIYRAEPGDGINYGEEAYYAWLGSSVHYGMMTNGSFSRFGVAFVEGNDGTWYGVQVFCD